MLVGSGPCGHRQETERRMGAEARRLRLWPLPTPVGQPRPGGLWLLSMALFMRWLCLRVSVLFSPRMRNTPWVFIPQGPHHALENHAGIHLPWVAHSEWTLYILQRSSPGGVVRREPRPPWSPAPTLSLPRETAASRTAVAARRAFQEVGSGSYWNPPNAAPNVARDSPIKKPPCPPANETAWGRDSTGVGVPVGAMQAPGSPYSRFHQGAP